MVDLDQRCVSESLMRVRSGGRTNNGFHSLPRLTLPDRGS